MTLKLCSYKLLLSFLLAMFLLSSCMKFDNPVELEPTDTVDSGAKIVANINNIHPEATLLVLELAWTESGKQESDSYRKTIALDGRFADLSFDFEDLPEGKGTVDVSSYIGTCEWQKVVGSGTIELSGTKTATIKITLGKQQDCNQNTDGDIIEPDGDSDLDTDTETELELEIDIEAEVDTDTEAIIWNPGASIDVPFSILGTDLNGILNTNDSQAVWDEWTSANSVTIQTILVDPVTAYFMHDNAKLMIGIDIPNISSLKDNEDNIGLMFDPNPSESGDEFVLFIWRETATTSCSAVSLVTCNDLPNGNPIFAASVSEAGYGWQLEMTLDYASLGISAGEAKSFAFSWINIDNDNNGKENKYFWPDDNINLSVPASWGEMTSSDDWAEPMSGDGDEELEIDFEIDTEADSTDIIIDGDLELDSTESDIEPETDTEIEEDAAAFCVPSQIYCEKQGDIWHARVCNLEGNAYDGDINCNDYTTCTKDLCAEGYGCYPENDDTATCSDGSYCTTNFCLSGECQHTGIICDEHPCRSSIQNPSNPVCCEYSNDDGGDCDDGFECSNGSCSGGECLPNWISGCCEGFKDDMVRIEEGSMDFCIDKYEAVIASETHYNNGCESSSLGTRYGEVEGVDDYPVGFPDGVTTGSQEVTLYACNNNGNNPSRMMTYFQAKTACENVGKDLCTVAEFNIGCAAGDTYPYGNAYAAGTCNDGDFLSTSGLNAACYHNFGDGTEDNVYDMSGNISELTKEAGSEVKACGGSFSSSAVELMCASCESVDYLTTDANRGFRCCADPQTSK